MPKTIIDILDQRAAATPDQIAYIYLTDGEQNEQSITYGELARRAKVLAYQLQRSDGTEQPVALLLPQGLSFIVGFFGCLYAGCIAVPTSIPGKNRGADKFNAIVQDAGIQVALTTGNVLNQLQKWHGGQPFVRSLNWLLLDNLDPTDGVVHPPPRSLTDGEASQSIAFLQYTSGSTGNPKGVMVTHRNMLANSEIIRQCFQNTAQSVSVCWLPSFHDMGLLDGIIQPVYVGFRSVLLAPVHFLQRPVRWLQALSTYRATYSGGPNFAFDQCINRVTPEEISKLDLQSLRCLYNGAEPIRAQTLRTFATALAGTGFAATKLLTCYGLAEATLAVTASVLGESPTIQQSSVGIKTELRQPNDTDRRERVSCGRTLVDAQLTIRHPDTHALCPDGVVGEIWVSGASISPGYWQKPALTAETFPVVGETRFLRTGDLGYVSSEELYVTGRLKDLIIIHGTNHYPQDIEQTVEQSHPDLQPNGGAAFSVPVDDRERLVLVQELARSALQQTDYDLIFDRVLAQVAARHDLAPYEIVLIRPGTLPKTTSGKVQRRTCCSHYLGHQLAVVDRWRKT